VGGAFFFAYYRKCKTGGQAGFRYQNTEIYQGFKPLLTLLEMAAISLHD
jgi:hypothetical protein